MHKLLRCGVLVVTLVLLSGIHTHTQAQDDDIPELMERLEAVPILSNLDTERVKEIFEAGQELGNRPNVFTKVGDSNTTSGDFLTTIGYGTQFCQWGDYEYLQETVEFFSEVPPHPDVRNSFTSYSIAAANGLSTASALDPFWAGNAICAPDESPIACEYRLSQPGVAIIMLGLMDARFLDSEQYRRNMDQIVQVTMEYGVIPVLTTFVVEPEQETLDYDESIRMNIATVDIAQEYEIPLINLWAAAQELPNHGIGPDHTHLSHGLDRFCDFAGGEKELGGTLRNLLTLQALHELREFVLED